MVEHSARGAVQSAYRLVVTAAATGRMLWDSGRVASDVTANVAYAGAPLADDADYKVAVTWWDGAGAAAPAAESTFSTALAARSSWAGLGPQPGTRGWRRLRFAPPLQAGPPNNVTAASASLLTPTGLAAIEWSSSLAAATVAVAVPANVEALLLLPLPAGTGASAALDESLGPVWARGAFVPGVPGCRGRAQRRRPHRRNRQR